LPLLGFLKGIFWFDVFARGLVRELDQDLEIKSGRVKQEKQEAFSTDRVICARL